MRRTIITYEEAQRIVQENGIKGKNEYMASCKDLGLPSHPDEAYKGKGWIGWYAFLGKEEGSYPTYEEAQRIVQENGILSTMEYKEVFRSLGLPSNPQISYKGKGWISWYDFFGKEEVSYPTYEEAQRIVQNNGILSSKEYKMTSKQLGLPSNPQISYKGKGWISWYAFFGKEEVSYPTYEEAQRIVQENGIKGKTGYQKSYKELGLPSDPHKYYKNSGWINWFSFLGKEGKKYPTYEEAQRIVQENGIKGKNEYMASFKELGLPSDPNKSYENKGWVDWYDFLGKTKKISSEERERRILTKLSINSVLLQDDMPLKILYMYAIEIDKRIAKEIEEILGIVSYEERLKWVNELLKSLKESSTIKGTTPSEESLDDILVGGSDVEDSDEIPNELLELGTMIDDIEEAPDEYSAIESVIEEFDDVKDTLSEKASTRINTQLENYLHSIVNKELIKEVDGE